MTEEIRHRGPDDAGAVSLLDREGGVAGVFGHRRLSILDLSSAGHQPMCTEDGRFVLTYNGEIYNFRELRDELRQHGVAFRSGSDTEVLLRGLALHGRGFVPRLRGMFAFGLWDRERGCALLARDPFGIKPLYLFEAGGVLLFASEVRALLASGSVPRVLDGWAVRSYLSTGAVAEPRTIVEGVRAIPAGTVVEATVRRGRVSVGAATPFSAPIPCTAPAVHDRGEAARGVRAALRASVERHLASDVPVGVFLSGGIDSSAVAALAREVSSGPLDTFNVSFAEEAFSESVHARAVAVRLGTRHHEISVSGADFLASLPESFRATDQPSMDGFNTFLVSRAVRERGIKVVLSGLGGDELFAGYPSFHRARRLAPLWALPRVARRVARAGAARLPGLRGEQLALLLDGEEPARAAYQASRMLFGSRQVRALAGGGEERLPAAERGAGSLLQQVSWHEVTGYMRNVLLRDSDVFSMAHGLELRVPFLDADVAAAAAAADDALKLAPGAVKPLLVEAVADLLPRQVWDRPKQGFVLPFDHWMRAELRDEIAASFGEGALREVGLNPRAVHTLWSDFHERRRGITWSRPWAVYTLVRWARENGVATAGAVPAPRAGERAAR